MTQPGDGVVSPPVPAGTPATLPPAVVPVTKQTLLPVQSVSYPAVLTGKANGQLPLSILVKASGLSGGPVVTLVTPTMRAWNAMVNDALTHGIILQATSTMDSYRPLAVQTSIFHERYTPTFHSGWATRKCGSITYYQKPGTASAACPGTSNHGLGIAVDVANASGGRLTWLLANAQKYGFSWEIQSEPWHIRYVAGDHIPAAVLAFEEEGGTAVSVDDVRIGLAQMADEAAKRSTPTGRGYADDLYTIMKAGLPTVPPPATVEITPAQLEQLANMVANKLKALTFVATPVDLEP